MLTGMDAFANHERELRVWISWAINLEPSPINTVSPNKVEKVDKGTKEIDIQRKSSPPFSCITFLSQSLASLINNPVPYLDRVTEAMVDAGSSTDQETDGSSVGTNEATIDGESSSVDVC